MEKTKKIGIDGRFFGAKDKGFGRYAENLIRNLEQIDKINHYFVFLRKDSWDEYQPKNPNFKKVLINYRWYGWKEQLLMPLELKKHKLDLMHFTHFNVPIFYRGNFIVTVHDLTLRYFPTFKKNLRSFLFYPFKKLAYYLVFGSAIKRAKKIIAVSKYTKKDILKFYKIDPNKIKVIYEGIIPVPSRITGSFGGRGEYLLYVGNAYPHKNLERLILAFKKLRQQGLQGLKLVLVGGEDRFYNNLKFKIKNLKLEDEVKVAGFISDEELDKLYRNASLYVFPSLYEGFGLPPLEAMARGLPVASSNLTCLPEILGDAAIYFNPLDINDIAEKIKKTLSDDRVRENLIQRGLDQIKKYSWQEMAKETLNIYRLF